MEFSNQVLQVVDELDMSRKHFRLLEQLEAAVTFFPMNIAEGKGRNSKGIHALFIYPAARFMRR